MRLIDADALKEQIPELLSHDDCIDIWIKRFDVEGLIDNAPTVDALPREYHDRVLDMTVAELQACQANLRPQGEWKVDGCLIACNKCGQIILKASKLYNFCPNCGADMRGADND